MVSRVWPSVTKLGVPCTKKGKEKKKKKKVRAQIMVGLRRRGSGHKTGAAKNTQNQFTRTPWLLPLIAAAALPIHGSALDPPIGWAAILRTMARSNRLIKLNRANESRANLAWGMHSSQWCWRSPVTTRKRKRERERESWWIFRELGPWGWWGGEKGYGNAWCCEFNDV